MKTRILFFCWIGSVFATLGDTFHVAYGIDAYPESPLNLLPFGVPVWVPVEFACAAGLMWWSRERFPGSSGFKRSWITTLVAGGGFLGIYISSALAASATLLLAAGTLSLALTGFQPMALAYCILTACVGTLVEISLVHLGVFSYLPPQTGLFGVPAWLPALYLPASVAVLNLPLTSATPTTSPEQA